jgi:hypothetical protein
LGAIEILLSGFAAPGGDPDEIARIGRLYERHCWQLLTTFHKA